MNASEPTDRRTGHLFLLIFLLLAAGILTAGVFYYRNHERRFRAEVERQLSAIAELKIGELSEWRKERLGDGATLFKNAAFSSLVRHFLARPEDAESQRQLQAWVEKILTSYNYDHIRLLDAQGVDRMSVPTGRAPLSSVVSRRILEVLRAGQVTFQDFYRNDYDQRVYLAVLVPILDETAAGRLLGVLILRIDPTTYLYPFINKWPTPSQTAETLIVRREGGEVVFLNELRFQSNTALNFRSSLKSTEMPAVKASLGQQGIMEGRDYRGMPVVAALRTVPDSPWFLVARMDTSEVYAPMREQLWQVVVMVAVLLLGAGASVGVAWRQQRVRFYRERYETAETLRQAEERYRSTMMSVGDGVIATNSAGQVDLLNPVAEALTGWLQEEARGKPLEEVFRIINEETRQVVDNPVRQVMRDGVVVGLANHSVLIAKDGMERAIADSGAPIRDGRGGITGVVLVFRDQTQERAAQRTLLEGEERYRSLFENMLNGFAYCRMEFEQERPRDFVYLAVNKAFESLTGLKDVVGKKVSEVIPGIREVDPGLFEIYGRVARTGVSERFEMYVEALGMWFAISVYSPGKDHFVAVFDVITDRKLADAALRASEAKYRALHESMMDAAVRVALDGRLIEFNSTYMNMLGYSSDELQALTYQELTPAKWHAHEAEIIEEQILKRGYSDVYEKEYRRKDGTVFPVELRAFLLNDSEGKPASIWGIARDITSRKAMESALRASEERFRRAVVDSPFPNLLHAEDGTILHVSNSWCEITGYSREELTTIDDWTERAYGDRKERVQEDINALYELDCRKAEGDYPVRTKDGTTRIWEFSSAPLGRLPDGRRLVLSMAMDVTERREAENDVRWLNADLEQRVKIRTRQLEAANKELEAFSYSVSHDLRAPLRAIDGFAHILTAEHARHLDAEGRRVLDIISGEARRMGRLIDDLLAFSRMNRLPMGAEDVDMGALAQAVFDECAAQAPGRKFEFKLQTMPVAHGDPAMLRQVLANLIANAIKYTRPKEIAEIEIGGHSEGEANYYYVKDNGVGFEIKYVHKLFGVFQRLHSEAEFEGTGVGLALVQRVIHRHGGRVWAEGKVNEGAAFHFTLPKRKE